MVQWNWLGLKPVFERGGRREEIFEREEERRLGRERDWPLFLDYAPPAGVLAKFKAWRS